MNKNIQSQHTNGNYLVWFWLFNDITLRQLYYLMLYYTILYYTILYDEGEGAIKLSIMGGVDMIDVKYQ